MSYIFMLHMYIYIYVYIYKDMYIFIFIFTHIYIHIQLGAETQANIWPSCLRHPSKQCDSSPFTRVCETKNPLVPVCLEGWGYTLFWECWFSLWSILHNQQQQHPAWRDTAKLNVQRQRGLRRHDATQWKQSILTTGQLYGIRSGINLQ